MTVFAPIRKLFGYGLPLGIWLTIGAICSAHGEPANYIGVGEQPCSVTLHHSQDQSYRSALLAWAGGYMSGINVLLVVRDENFHDVSALNVELIVGTILAYCAKHTADPTFRGVDSLIQTLPLRQFAK
jgi:hypothetical protein